MSADYRTAALSEHGVTRSVLATLTAVPSVLVAILITLQIPLLGILVTTASIVYEDRLPLLTIGSISLHVADILLLGSLGTITLHVLAVNEARFVRTQLDRPLLVFLGITLLATGVALLRSSVEAHEAFRATRVVSYYLTFFIVTNSVRTRRQLDFLISSMFLLATIVAAAMIGQYVLGDSVELLPGRVEALSTQGTTFEAVTRIAPPGLSLVILSFVTGVSVLVLQRVKAASLLRFLHCGVLGIALLITFLRSYWAALIVVMALLMYLVRGPDRRRFVRWSTAAVGSVVLVLVGVFGDPDSAALRLVSAAWDRLSTLGSSGTFHDPNDSVDWRMIENSYASSAIASSPLIGLGMGATYRRWDSRLDFIDADGLTHDFRRHIHNGHVWILLQSGLLGYLSFMWLSAVFLTRGFGRWRSIPNDRLRGVVLGISLAYVAVLIAAIANSSFMQWNWTPVIGTMMGINEVILRKYSPLEFVAVPVSRRPHELSKARWTSATSAPTFDRGARCEIASSSRG